MKERNAAGVIKTMQYTQKYRSPLGEILLAADEQGLRGLWFEGQKYFAYNLEKEHEERSLPVFEKTSKWLDEYFAGAKPDSLPPLHIIGTDFQKKVWEILLKIPYGKTMTYKEIAGKVAEERGLERMFPQAVGGAVGHNAISIIIPCHRVVGTNGSLTGYAGGLERKMRLLQLEQ